MRGGCDEGVVEKDMVVALPSEELQIPWKKKSKQLGSTIDDIGETYTTIAEQLKKAEGTFYAESKVLLCRMIGWEKRIKHYLRYVVPVALSGCGAWTCSQGALRMIHGFEAQCLKRMFMLPKKKDLPWPLWHRTVTLAARAAFSRVEKKSLVVKYLERLIKFAATTFHEQSDCAPLAMVRGITTWRSTVFWKTCQNIAETQDRGWKHHGRGTLRTRWDEVFVECLGDDYVNFLKYLKVAPSVWRELVNNFVTKALNFYTFELAQECVTSHVPVAEPPEEIPQIKKLKREEPVTYFEKKYLSDKTFHIEIIGDSSCVVSWMNLTSSCSGVMEQEIDKMRQLLHYLWANMNFAGNMCCSNFFKWIPRDYNKTADVLAGIGSSTGNRIMDGSPVRLCSRFFRVHFDGSCADGVLGGGYHLEQAWCMENGLPVWRPGPQIAFTIPVTDKLPPYAITAETIACKQALMAITMAVDMGQVVVNPKTCRVELMGKIAEFDKKFGIA